MKVCIVGGGNMGLAMASAISLNPDYEVCLLSSKMFDVSEMTFRDVEGGVERNDISFDVVTDMATALDNAEYIFVTYPAFLRKGFVEKASEYLKPGCKLGFVPGYGGAEYACNDLINKGVTVFGLQRVPYVARQEGKKLAQILSKKKNLYIATIPKRAAEQVCADVYSMLEIPVVQLNEYLAVTLAPSNPLLHLTGVYGVFKDYKPGDYFDSQLMFYEEWNDETSELLFKYDAELQEICNKMKPLDLQEVVSLSIYYESPTPADLTRKLKSIPSLYEVVKVPLVEEDGKYYPDYNNRMFIEDFPFGIAIIKYFAILTGVDTPAIDTILKYYEDAAGICYFNEDGTPGPDFDATGVPALYGLDTLDKIVEFYRQ